MNKYEINNNIKYLSNNPISKYLIKNFNKKIKTIISNIEFNSFLDIGSGEGLVLTNLMEELKNKNCYGIDINESNLKMAKKNVPFCNFKYGNIYKIPFPDNSFDIVSCMETLEHLEYPSKAIEEIKRVSSKTILVSVPREPLWSLLNIIRGKYWKYLGNTPAHLNQWSTSSIIKLLEKYFKIVKIYKPIPWTIIVLKKVD
jgi:ubiquinone/menaquinone biosynthesis C-methylase UbiE